MDSSKVNMYAGTIIGARLHSRIPQSLFRRFVSIGFIMLGILLIVRRQG